MFFFISWWIKTLLLILLLSFRIKDLPDGNKVRWEKWQLCNNDQRLLEAGSKLAGRYREGNKQYVLFSVFALLLLYALSIKIYQIWLVPSRLSWERREARGVMGRRKGERRLADPVFKMVDELMADGAEILNLENRLFHRAYLSRKLPCPHILCRAELGRAFFEASSAC